MSLTLHSHPLSSYCWKALIALREKRLDFDVRLVDFADPQSRDAFLALAPFGKMPVLVDASRGKTVAEASVIVEYLDLFYRDGAVMIPAEADAAWTARMWDRFFDLYLHAPMQAAVKSAFNPDAAAGRETRVASEGEIRRGYGVLEGALTRGPWMLGDAFSIADCAAAPALFYCDVVTSLGPEFPRSRAYLDRLLVRPSVRRVMAEAEPYFPMFPLEPKPRLRP